MLPVRCIAFGPSWAIDRPDNMEKSYSTILGLNFSIYIVGTIIPQSHSWKLYCGSVQVVVAITGDLGAGAGPGPSYHAELGLQFNLQALEHPPEFRHLAAASLHLFAVRGDFSVQLLGLRWERRGEGVRHCAGTRQLASSSGGLRI